MKRTLAIFALSALMCATLGSCVKDGTVDRGDINAAIKLSTVEVKAASATISGTSAQENVVSCYLAGPVEVAEVNFANYDAIDRKAYILEHGTEMTIPFEVAFTGGLKPETSYMVAVIGKDAQGVFRTAPYYITFKTGSATVSTSLSIAEEGAGYKYTYSILKGENTKEFKYIVSEDKSTVGLDEAGLRALIKAGGSDVKTSSTDIPAVTINKDSKCDMIVAALAFDELGNEGGFSSSVVTGETIVKAIVNGAATVLSPEAEGSEVYVGTIDMPASATFTINKDNVDYGFTSYSGAGGIGTVNSVFSSVPFVNLTSDMTYKFKVSKAIGQMSATNAGGNAFYANMDAAAKVQIRADFSADPAIYRFEVVNEDANLVFYEGFDLCTWGGFYQAPVKGGKPADASTAGSKGTEPVVMSSVSTTANGFDNFCYPSTMTLDGSETHINDTLMTNWGLQDWTFKKGYLSCGHIRIGATLSGSTAVSYVITPKFTKLTSATNVTVTIEGFDFASSVLHQHFAIVGDGKYTGATVTNTAGYNETFTVSTDGLLTEKSFDPNGTMFPKHANADFNKTMTKVVLQVEGATANTQIRLGTDDTPIGDLKEVRICIDYIKVTK